jgi:hypothetical protein
MNNFTKERAACILYHEDGSSIYLWNICNCLAKYTPSSSYTKDLSF